MAVAKKKLSKSGWILLAILFIAAITLIVLHFVGIVDLSFLGAGYAGLMIWAGESGWNALIVGIAHSALGFLVFYFLKSYFIGEKQVIPAGYGYTPPGQTVSPQAQQKDETVIST